MNKKRYEIAFWVSVVTTVVAYASILFLRSEAAHLAAQGCLGVTLLIAGLTLKKYVESEPIRGIPACGKK